MFPNFAAKLSNLDFSNFDCNAFLASLNISSSKLIFLGPFIVRMGIVKRMQRDTAKLQKSLPKCNRSSLFVIQRVQNKMFGACQSSIAKELKDASMGDACWDIYVGKDDN